MMDEAVALATTTSDDEDDEDSQDTDVSKRIAEEKVNEFGNNAANDSTPATETPLTTSTPPQLPPPKHSPNNDREAQQKETYYRRNQELNLTQRYAPNDRCWLIGFLMRGPFQLCMN